MTDIPISWQIKIYGVKEAENDLKRLKEIYGDVEGEKRFNQILKENTANIKSNASAMRLSNTAHRVNHQTLYEAGKAYRIFGSAMRSAMSIMNTINLLTLAQNSRTTGLKSDLADLKSNAVSLELELANLEKHGKKNTIEYALKLNEYENVKRQIKDLQTEIIKVGKDETWNNWIAAGFGIAEGVGAMFSILNNPILGTKIIDAFTPIFGSIGKAAALAGTKAGTMFGLSFAGAVSVAIIAVGAAILAGAVDIMMENVSGQSFVRDLTEKLLGKGNGMSTKDILGINEHNGADLRGQGILGGPNSYQDYIKGYEGSGNKPNDMFDQITKFFTNMWTVPNSYQDDSYDFTKRVGEGGGKGIGVTDSIAFKVTKGESQVITEAVITGFKDLVPETVFVAENLKKTNKTQIKSNEILTKFNEFSKSDVSAREKMREETEQHRLELEANRQALFENTEAMNKARVERFQQIAMMNSTGGGGWSSGNGLEGGAVINALHGGSSGGYVGSNGKVYKDEETAHANGAANGFDGIVNRPTLFMTGENGPESVTVTPLSKPKNNSGVTINNYISGSVLAQKELDRITMQSLKDGLKRAGFG